MSDETFDVPGPLPDDMRAALGLPHHLPVYAFAAHDDPLVLVVHSDHLDGSRNWVVAWEGGGWTGVETALGEFEPRRHIGEPPASVATWVAEQWSAITSGVAPRRERER